LRVISQLRSRFAFEGNLRVLLIRRVLLAVSGGLTAGLSTLYVKEILGADAIILGSLGSIWSMVFVLFILLGGWIGDRYDRKKVLLAGTGIVLINPIIYALAPNWHVIILVNFIGAVGSAISTPAYNAIIYSSIEQKKRSQFVATLVVMASIANIVTPPFAAYIIQLMGGLEEIRKMFFAQFLISLFVWIYTLKRLEAVPFHQRRKIKGVAEAVKDMFSQMRHVYQMARERKASSWIAMYILGPFAWQLVSPFWSIYAAEVCMAPLLIIGLLPAIDGIIRLTLQLPLARIADRSGRKKIILTVWPLSLRTEVMPKRYQGTWNALLNFIWYLSSIPASFLGGLLWNIDPRLPFIFALTVDAGLRYPILMRLVPETLVPTRRAARIGPHILIYGLSEAGLTSTARLIQRTMKAEIINVSHMDIRRLSRILRNERKPVIIEGTPALYVANDEQDSVRVLLVASREERTRRRAQKDKKPEFVALKEIEDEDRRVNRIARRLYHADLSNMPPFDVAINTERVSPEKVARIIEILREEERKRDSEKDEQTSE